MVVYVFIVSLTNTQFAAHIFAKFARLNDLVLGGILLGLGTMLLVQNMIS